MALGEYLVGSVPFAGETLREFAADACNGVGTASASIGAQRPMACESSAACTASAVLGGALSFGIQASGLSESSAILSDLIDLGGESAGVGSTGDALANALRPVVVETAGVGDALVTLKNRPGLRVDVAGEASAAAALNGALSADLVTGGQGVAATELAALVPFGAVAASGQAGESVTVAALRPFEAASAGVASTSGSIVALRPAGGEIRGEASCSLAMFKLAVLPVDAVACSGSVSMGLSRVVSMTGQEIAGESSAEAVLSSQQAMTIDDGGTADFVVSIVGQIVLMAEIAAGIGRADLAKIRATTADGGERVDVDTGDLTSSPVEFRDGQGDDPQIMFDVAEATPDHPTIDIIASEVSGATISVDSVGSDRPTIQIRGVF